MNIRVEYGIICQRENEKEIVKRINDFLEKEYKYGKMEKTNEEAVSEFSNKYYCCQFTKEKPLWYFELYPNVILDKKIVFDKQGVEWLLYVSKQSVENNTEEENGQMNMFFEKLMEAIGYEIVVLHEYKNNNEKRIRNIK